MSEIACLIVRVAVNNVILRVRPHRKQEIAAICDLVTPDRARQLRAVQCEEKPSS